MDSTPGLHWPCCRVVCPRAHSREVLGGLTYADDSPLPDRYTGYSLCLSTVIQDLPIHTAPHTKGHEIQGSGFCSQGGLGPRSKQGSRFLRVAGTVLSEGVKVMRVPLWGHHFGDVYEGPSVGVCQLAGLQLSLLSGKVHTSRAPTHTRCWQGPVSCFAP